MSFDAITMTEISERNARVNTFVRFNKTQAALNEAYKLRLDIQTSGLQGGRAANELRTMLDDLDATIDTLEKKKFSGPGRLLLKVLRAFQLMLEGKEEEDRIDL
ncbi:MAG: hypothetical protein AMXMBFR33_24560 [Candidatus Xenobia bacterium]|jgi:hypothetical protein